MRAHDPIPPLVNAESIHVQIVRPAHAAYHHESATRHHRAAENAYGSGDHKKAAHEAQIAQSHATKAKRHADLAAKEYLEHHGTYPVEGDGDA